MQHFRANPLGLLPRGEFEQAVRQHKAERYRARVLRAVIVGGQCYVLPCFDRREACERFARGWRPANGNCGIWGFLKRRRSPYFGGYANEHRPWQLYETVFHQLLGRCVSDGQRTEEIPVQE